MRRGVLGKILGSGFEAPLQFTFLCVIDGGLLSNFVWYRYSPSESVIAG